jgi:uncharacterized membrane protein
MTKSTLQSFIAATKGKFFSVTFTKKNGERRVLNGKEKYFRLLKGGQNNLAGTPYCSVVDRNLEDWRAVNGETVMEFKCGNIKYSSIN